MSYDAIGLLFARTIAALDLDCAVSDLESFLHFVAEPCQKNVVHGRSGNYETGCERRLRRAEGPDRLSFAKS